MKHAIILAHPSQKSLNAAIAQTYREAVERLGDEVIVRDLYAMRFNPCLRAAEIPGPKKPVFGVEVRRERALLADVDVFAFVYRSGSTPRRRSSRATSTGCSAWGSASSRTSAARSRL
jgi:NAD(P)H dehydrogenase (quinone)